MKALVVFGLRAYVRSLRVLPPLIVVLLIICVVLLPGLSGSGGADLATGALGDVPAMLFPIWAWVARALPDTQPDEQQALSATAARHPLIPTAAGLVASFVVNLGLGALAMALPLAKAVATGVGPAALAAGVLLLVLAALGATLLGAYTTRARIPAPGVSLLTLLAANVAVLLVSFSPVSWLSAPMTQWVRAAHDGPNALTAETPSLALHLLLWSTALAVGHTLLSRHPR
ncbi:MAG TPA: hypothetical protein VHJ17_20620 [Thermomonospora sp.]|nr:hypothetical protein [Thermomonospora sp.]